MSNTACIPPRSLHGYGAFLRMWDQGAQEWDIIAGTTDLAIPSVVREAVETNDAIAALNLKLRDPGEVRRLGRVMLGYQASQDVYHGPRTDKFVADVIAAFGFNKENTSPQ